MFISQNFNMVGLISREILMGYLENVKFLMRKLLVLEYLLVYVENWKLLVSFSNNTDKCIVGLYLYSFLFLGL